jgi:lysophospholipase L1-like esterase
MHSIFILGDSISIQYGPFLTQALAGFADVGRKSGLEEALRDLNLAQGANGGDSRNCLQYLQEMVRAGALHLDLLLLNCGLHDIKCQPDGRQTQVPPDQYEANLQAIVQLLRDARIPLAWIRTTPVDEAKHNVSSNDIWRWSADVDRYNAIADAVMKKARVPMIDLHGFTRSLGQDVTTDGRHFPEVIQRLQGAFIAGWVQAQLTREWCG